jgi:putative ABC transport system permease protein
MLGIYGVMSCTVAQRVREIGIRIALGARGSDVRRMVLGQAVHLTSLGIAVGLLVAFIVARLISSVFFGVGPADLPTLGMTSVLLLGAAMLASAWPARRAAAVDPAVALRGE